MGGSTRSYGHRSVTIPYSHMDWDDACMFYEALNSLLTYANRRLGVVDGDDIVIDGDDFGAKRDAVRVGEMLWRNRWVIEEFVKGDPGRLGKARLAMVDGWRHAVRATLTCMGANPDFALYMADDALFVVGAMESAADFFVRSLPSLVLVTMLPFKGGIVVDGKVMGLSDEPVPGAVESMTESLRGLLREGRVVSTASELVAYCDTHDGGNLVPASTQAWLDLQLGLGLETGG